jgi:hypothetical protein
MIEHRTRVGSSARRRVGRLAGLICALLLLGGAPRCERDDDRAKDEEQRMLRAERLARERARRARNERIRRRNLKWRAKDPPPVRRVPAGPCKPWPELKRRIGAVGFNDRFGRAVRQLLAPIKADLITLSGRPIQRFTFVVRMHPDEEPRFGRKKPRPLLELDLRFTPLCKPGAAGQKHRLRVRVAHPRKKGVRAVTSLWPQKPARKDAPVPVGKQIQLLLDPSRAQLRAARPRPKPRSQMASRSGRKRSRRLSAFFPTTGVSGIWEVTGARFPDRPRLRRVSLPSSKLPAVLNVLHAVEVPCGNKGQKRCRYLTRQRGHRSLAMSLKGLHKLAAPIDSRGRVLHLHAALLALRFPKCGGDTRRASRKDKHLCARWPQLSGTRACQFWRAQHGYATPPSVHQQSGTWRVLHVISCPAKKLRILQLDETYAEDGKHRLKVHDLARRTKEIDAELRRMKRSRGRRP